MSSEYFFKFLNHNEKLDREAILKKVLFSTNSEKLKTFKMKNLLHDQVHLDCALSKDN